MRFHTIKIENLNSLAGRHEIDLEGALAGAGLFLIHGPTGAGKSTILDAICLALYGKTPRLDDRTKQKAVEIDGVRPNDPSLVMTRGEVSCLAELELSMTSPEGRLERYRAKWAVQRAGKKATGKFQEPKRRLEVLREQSGWTVLVDGTKKAEVDEKFGAMLQGLSFEDFQRTTLLAQFAFRQFLEADEKQRGELLARMTDGGRFKEIGNRAYLARKAAQEALDRLEAELGGKAVWSEAEEAERRATLAAKEAEATALEVALAGLGRKREVWGAWRAAKDSLVSAETEHEAVHAERAARGGDLSALAVDRALGPARQALEDCTRRRATTEAARLEAAREVVARDEVVGRRGALAERRAAAAQAREVAAAAYEARRPELAVADQAWSSWRQAQETVAAKVKDATAREAAWVKAVAVVEAAHARHAEAQTRLAEVDAQLAEIPQRELLLGEIKTLEEMLDAQKKQGAELARKKAALAERREDGERLAVALAQASEAQAALEEAWAAARGRVAEAEGVLATLAGGATPEAVARSCAERGAELQAMLTRLDALDGMRAEVLRLRQAVSDAGAEAAKGADAVEVVAAGVMGHEAEERRLDDGIEAARREVELLGKVVHLVDQRSVLRAGQACPLCGGVEHPYVEAPATAPDSAEVRAELEEAQRRLTALSSERAQVRRVLEAARTEQLRLGARASELSAREVALTGELAKAHAKTVAEEQVLEIGEGPTGPRREGAQAALERVEGEGRRLAGIAAALRDARTAEEQARVARDRGAAARHGVESELSRVEAFITTEAAAIADADRNVEVAANELTQRLLALEIREARRTDGVAEARRRADLAKELTQKRDGAAVAVTSAELACGQAVAGRDASGRERERAEAEHTEAEARLAAAEGALHFEGRDPASVRAELEGAERATRQEDEQAASALAAADSALAAAEAMVAGRAEALARAEGELAAAEVSFEAQRLACGAASADDVRARSLDEARRAELSALEERLAHRQTAATAKVEAARGALAGAEARLLQEGEAGEAATRLVAIEDERRAAAEALSERQQEVGALRAELERNGVERAAVAVLKERVEAARDDRDQWNAVAELIGTDQGKAFADLVQSLNLGAVIERANVRLARFMERYALTQAKTEQGIPRLDFLVIDRYQDDAQRGTKSLSGGESFIVSLALALGLADLRSSRLRIDTLLIDEGFGSLDMKTLQDVLAALTALQAASGAQIGLISHVDAMKEVIPAQIEVVPLGDGRSSVAVRS